MKQRRILKIENAGSTVLKELITNIFVAELLCPSKEEVWVVSPWISNIPLIDNRSGSFDVLNPDWRGQIVRLQDIITFMVSIDTKIRLITNNDDHNDNFLRALSERTKESGNNTNLSIQRRQNLHIKTGLLNDHGCLDGSMNITYTGIEINDEKIIYSIGRDLIDHDRVTFKSHYGRWDDRE